jgi:hypothetical protein
MNNELKRIWKEEGMVYIRYHSGICEEEEKKTTKKTSVTAANLQAKI